MAAQTTSRPSLGGGDWDVNKGRCKQATRGPRGGVDAGVLCTSSHKRQGRCGEMWGGRGGGGCDHLLLGWMCLVCVDCGEKEMERGARTVWLPSVGSPWNAWRLATLLLPLLSFGWLAGWNYMARVRLIERREPWGALVVSLVALFSGPRRMCRGARARLQAKLPAACVICWSLERQGWQSSFEPC